jgi:intracellular multiplication protein IcmP
MAASNDDPAWLLMLIICILAGLGWVIWYFFHPQFLEALRYVRLVEMAVPAVFDSQASACLSWLYHAPVEMKMPTEAVYESTLGCFGAGVRTLSEADRMKYYTVSVESLGLVSTLVGSYLRWIVFALCCVAAYYATFVSKRNKFKIRHNLESFIKAQSEIWPVISPIKDFNPSKHSARILGQQVPDKLPLFAEPLSPEEWISFHRIPVVNGVPDREATRRAFCLQLGPRWEGYDNLPPYIQGLCAAFALKGVQKREESDEFLGRLSVCWSPSNGYQIPSDLMREIRSILKDPAVGGKALEIANKHAFRTTALLGLLKWARFMGGVLAAAQFLWLRGVDRQLWYSLNNQGRRTFHSEGAGAIAHFMAEEQAQKALPVPRMDTAIVTLNIYMGGDAPVEVPPREEPSQARG